MFKIYLILHDKALKCSSDEETCEADEDVFYDFESNSISSSESQGNITKVSYDPSINIEEHRNELQQLVPLRTGMRNFSIVLSHTQTPNTK